MKNKLLLKLILTLSFFLICISLYSKNRILQRLTISDLKYFGDENYIYLEDAFKSKFESELAKQNKLNIVREYFYKDFIRNNMDLYEKNKDASLYLKDVEGAKKLGMEKELEIVVFGELKIDKEQNIEVVLNVYYVLLRRLTEYRSEGLTVENFMDMGKNFINLILDDIVESCPPKDANLIYKTKKYITQDYKKPLYPNGVIDISTGIRYNFIKHNCFDTNYYRGYHPSNLLHNIDISLKLHSFDLKMYTGFDYYKPKSWYVGFNAGLWLLGDLMMPSIGFKYFYLETDPENDEGYAIKTQLGQILLGIAVKPDINQKVSVDFSFKYFPPFVKIQRTIPLEDDKEYGYSAITGGYLFDLQFTYELYFLFFDNFDIGFDILWNILALSDEKDFAQDTTTIGINLKMRFAQERF